jgi:hypothetical protein
MSNLSVSAKKGLAFFNPLFVRFCVGIGLIAMVASSQTTDIALRKTATSSSNENTTNVSGNAVDGNTATRWSSAYSDPQWIQIDLGSSYTVSRVTLTWEAASAKNFTIDVSANGTSWTTISTKVNMAAGARTDDITGLSGVGRYIRMNGTARTSTYGYSIFTFAVYGTSPTNYTLSTAISPAGTGSITLNPAGGTYASGTVVTVTANPASGYQFNGFGGDISGTTNPTSITMNGNKSVTANFTPTTNGYVAGDLTYFNGTQWVRIPKGNSGQVLTENASQVPTWTDPIKETFVMYPCSLFANTTLLATGYFSIRTVGHLAIVTIPGLEGTFPGGTTASIHNVKKYINGTNLSGLDQKIVSLKNRGSLAVGVLDLWNEGIYISPDFYFAAGSGGFSQTTFCYMTN